MCTLLDDSNTLIYIHFNIGKLYNYYININYIILYNLYEFEFMYIEYDVITSIYHYNYDDNINQNYVIISIV